MKVYISKTLKGCLLFIWALGFPVSLWAQSMDSLEKVLATNKMTEKEKIQIYHKLVQGYFNLNYRKAIDYGLKGVSLSEKFNDEKMLAKFYSNIGNAYYRGGVFDTATYYLDKAILVAQKLKDYRIEVVASVAYGAIYQEQSLYDQSLKSYFKAAKILESRNDSKGLSTIYSNIGGIYQILKNYGPALSFLEKAKKIALERNDKGELVHIYISLSDIALHQDKPKEVPLEYAKQALRIAQERDSKYDETCALQMLAMVYYYYGDHEAALPTAKKGLQKAKELGFPNLIAHSLLDMSNSYYFSKKYAPSAEAALEILKTDTTDTNVAINAYANLIQANAYLGRPDLTEYYLKTYREVLDRYANQSYQNSLSEMEVKYDSEIKELQIDTLKKERKMYLWLGIAGGLILLSALAFAVMRYRLAVSKRKLAEKETQRMEQEKQLVAVQATLDGEAAERTRLAKDLHDGLGSMLSVVKFNLPQMKGDAWLESLDVSRFQTALGMLDDSIHELRRVAHHMMPETLLRFGLKVSISDFCDAIPMTDFHYFGDEARLPEKLEIMVYRCIHELVNNALKHAKANHINVQLVQEKDRLSFTVQDDGTGFDQNAIPEGMGLRNIRQRVEAFRGKMNIYSLEQGTEIHVEMELTKDE